MTIVLLPVGISGRYSLVIAIEPAGGDAVDVAAAQGGVARPFVVLLGEGFTGVITADEGRRRGVIDGDHVSIAIGNPLKSPASIAAVGASVPVSTLEAYR